MKLVPARLNILKPSSSRDFDIYILNETKPVLLLSKDAPLNKDSQIFQSNANRIVYIPFEQLANYKQAITKHLEEILKDKSIPKSSKMYAIYVSLTNQLEKLMNSGQISVAKNISREISLFIANTLNDTGSISIFLSFIKNDAHNIALHMFNVGTYATLLTKMLYPDISRAQLEKLSRGYFLHDIGMLKIDRNVVNKKGKYTPEEFEFMKQHPILGVQILKEELGIHDQSVLKIVLEHHERSDGSGYPYGKTNINRFARICAICDVFDAMTSKRSYKERTPKTTFEALKEEKEFFLGEFGKELYEAFVKSLGARST